MYGGQSSEGFLVDHHLLLSKRRNRHHYFTKHGEITILTVSEKDVMMFV